MDTACRQRTCASLCLFVVVSCVASLLAGQKTGPGDRTLYREGFVTIVAPDGATVQETRNAAKSVLAAWKFDLGCMHWSHPADVDGPLTVQLVSDERLKRQYPGARAHADADGKRFIVKMGLLDDRSLDLTIAHELGHMQAYRILAGRKVPKYFLEGHGLLMNERYAETLGIDRHEGGHSQVKALMSISPEEARTILTDPNYVARGGPKEESQKRDYKMEVMGLFFVQRVCVGNSGSDPATNIRRVLERVKDGGTYEQSFARVYGVSFDHAVSDVEALFRQTSGHQSDRFKGMGLEQYASAPAVSAARSAPAASAAKSAPADGKTIDMKEAARVVAQSVATQLALNISVSCPPAARPMKAGDTFECTAAPKGGGRLVIKVTQKDNEGNIRWEVVRSDGLLDVRVVEQAVVKGLKDQASVDATVHCDGHYRTSRPGDVFQCQATTKDNAAVTIDVTIKDENGNVAWKLRR